LSSRRLIPSRDFTLKYFSLFPSKRQIVKSAIKELENGNPVVQECPETNRRHIVHKNCRLYFRNDVLLDFEFIQS
jgi:hypothetical protein